MTDNSMVITTLYSLVSLAGLALGLFLLHHDYFVDSFRQQLFALRDELFDLAADGEIPFDSPAYLLLRSTINGFIQYAHKLSIVNTVLLRGVVKTCPTPRGSFPTFQRQWDAAVREINPETATKLSAILRRMNFLVIAQILRSSPIILLVALVAGLVVNSLAMVMKPFAQVLLAHAKIMTETATLVRSVLNAVLHPMISDGQVFASQNPRMTVAENPMFPQLVDSLDRNALCIGAKP